MSDIKIYGIKNCDTMKKAFKWFDAHGVAYDFHDYKKSGVDDDVLKGAMNDHGWEAVINRRGTTWRQLDDDLKANMDSKTAIKVAIENPSIVKRPLILDTKSLKTYLGFEAKLYETAFL